MQQLLLVALGGAIGSVARFKLSGFILHQAIHLKFPLGTFVVNIVGCLIIGMLAGLGERWGGFPAAWKVFLFTGVVGGFTTFSAFGLETMLLLKSGELLIALLYVTLSIVVGLVLMYGSFLLFR
ncbi:fluoride efflux transporter CrcB [Methylobacillus arboreus]|uniref:fluoride efflux transporter CrcB n=1 Tax=Methylobacillus arboreus TaxID=755170 RepID=UPI001E4B85E3|nr:fluoride efflux transporter CrcB [Methylobacillus arboreus]MCB5191455.1 fluoride efflux transporter CrcB [Methylobacillus arboreus]